MSLDPSHMLADLNTLETEMLEALKRGVCVDERVDLKEWHKWLSEEHQL